ncbi:MAG TPA: 16S rRNA (cytosine(1402)-N(4))-methyltransferase RsmH [Opitutaceae bacterium]|nr:16S rRNA (cytosine(1402)-N(4))-methyltransferase RsmH [Opitutaceae bacterium]
MPLALPEFSSASMIPGHQPVLLGEVMGFLSPVSGGRYLDCTFGGGGHTRAILEAADGVEVVALDRDPEAKERAERLASEFSGRFTLIDQNFGRLADIAGAAANGFDGVLFDFGLSSYQIDDSNRGFSFRSDAPADMRMDPRSGVPASQWLETATEEMLVRAVRDFGEETHWRRIVRAVIAARGTGALGRTATLASLISEAIPTRDRMTSRVHPATRSFQGIRIAVNDELGAIDRALPAAFGFLRPSGVLCAISFHSLEDRPVKQFFRKMCGQPENANDSTPQDFRICKAEALTRKPVVPTDEEIAANPRSRSAKLRAIRKL